MLIRNNITFVDKKRKKKKNRENSLRTGVEDTPSLKTNLKTTLQLMIMANKLQLQKNVQWLVHHHEDV